MSPGRFDVRAVTFPTLDDLHFFASKYGKFGYCSCMRWRMTSSEFQRSSRQERSEALDLLVQNRVPIGLLGYMDQEPITWCSIAPRETFEGIRRSKTFTRVDSVATWSVTCFFIAPKFRGIGLQQRLLEAAVQLAGKHGASAVEAYPPEKGGTSYRNMGSVSFYEKAGFQRLDLTGEGLRYRQTMYLLIPRKPGKKVPEE